MRRKSENIVSFTTAELEARQAHGETLTDWTKAAAPPVPDGGDPDDALEPVDWAMTELPMPRAKVHASLRLDADVLDWFKGQGRCYQTKINAVLRSYFRQRTR